MRLPTALTIAGSDSSGGAGIQADIKTMLANGVYAMSAVTALTAQNTAGVAAILEATPEFLAKELDMVFEDIRPDAVKIGMVASVPLIRVIAGRLRAHGAAHIVVDPVMVAASGARLIAEDAVAALTEELFPLAEVVTPNLPELAVLDAAIQGAPPKEAREGALPVSREARAEAARRVAARYRVAVLAKGGHAAAEADDLLVTDAGVEVFPGARIETGNTHGTGCTLSSAIAANLAKGMKLPAAVGRAKEYVTGALAAGLDLGRGSGPLHHGFAIRGGFAD